MDDGLLPPGGGAMYFPGKNEQDPDDDTDEFHVCADCDTRMLLGDEDFCLICQKRYCEECFEDHDCGSMVAQVLANEM